MQEDGAYLATQNQWGRLLSVHGLTGDFEFALDEWVDYMLIQSGNDATYAEVYRMGIANRALAAKPLINEEFGVGTEDLVHRQRAWSAFMASAAGTGTGAFLQHLSAFVVDIPFETMEPADYLVLAGEAFVMAALGQSYVAYLPIGGDVELDLSTIPGQAGTRWFNPADGTWSEVVHVTGGGPVFFTPPAPGDWAFVLWAL